MGNQGVLFDLPAGLQRKRDGQASVLDHESEEWKQAVRAVVGEMAQRHRPITSDDLRVECVGRGLPEPRHWNSWGGMMSAMGAAGVLRRTGARHRSARPEARGREISVWIGR